MRLEKCTCEQEVQVLEVCRIKGLSQAGDEKGRKVC